MRCKNKSMEFHHRKIGGRFKDGQKFAQVNARNDINYSKECHRINDIACSPNGYNFVTSATSNNRNTASLLIWNMKTNFQVEVITI
jgi:hypothetical protein